MSSGNGKGAAPAGSGIILVGPKYPENIGAAARIAFNFGFDELIVVGREEPDRERMLKMATHKAAHLIHNMRLVRETVEAAGSFHFVVGTTARQGRQRQLIRTPREVMAELAPLAAGSRVALMFGPENCGLTNADLDCCQFYSSIPTACFASLNLAQAVAIHCYEFFMAINDCRTRHSEADYANVYDLEGMYAHIEQALTRTTFLRESNHAYWMRNIRQFLGRVRIRKKEASLIRGICRKFLWYADNRMQAVPEADQESSEAG